MGLTDRFRGQVVVGGVLSNQIAHLSSSPLANPTIVYSGETSTAGGAPVFCFTISMNAEAYGDTDGLVLARRASMLYHFETTAGALLDGALFSAAAAGNTSGLTAVGVVIPNSTVAGGRGVGRIICSSTGVCTAAFTTASGSVTTGVLVLTLPNGLIATSSQVSFTS